MPPAKTLPISFVMEVCILLPSVFKEEAKTSINFFGK